MSTASPPQTPPRHPRRQNRGRGTPRGGRARGRGHSHPADLRTGGATAAQAQAQGQAQSEKEKEKEGVAPADAVDDNKMDVASSEVCFICASPVVYTAIAPCNHQTCHICSLRLRALYKTKACAHCRVS